MLRSLVRKFDKYNMNHYYCLCVYYIHSFIHTGYFYSASSKSTTTQRHSRLELLCRSDHAKVLQATVSEGLAQGHNVMAGVGFELVTIRTNGFELTTESHCAPPFPICVVCV